MRPIILSTALEAIVGNGPMPRTQVVKKLWAYIKKNKLQDPVNKRNIKPNEQLAKIFGSKKPINMFEVAKKINNHLSF